MSSGKDKEMALARTNDPITSHEAGESITYDTANNIQKKVLSIFTEHKHLDDRALLRIYRQKFDPDVAESTVRTRRHELVIGGLLEDSGLKIKQRNGRRAIVWKIK